MSNNPALAQLKDILSPTPPSWWPLAPGWYGVIILVLLIIGVTIYLLWRRHQRRHRLRLALQILNQLRTNTHKHYVASELSVLLRKALLAHYPRQQVAGLQGENWLAFLDSLCHSTDFTQGEGRLLLTAPYAPHTNEDMDNLFTLVERIIRRCLS